MRRSLTVALLIIAALLPWYLLYPVSQVPHDDMPAEFLSSVKLKGSGVWAGGFSGLELTQDGQNFLVVSDRGYMAAGQIERAGGDLTDVIFNDFRQLASRNSKTGEKTWNDAEGLALDSQGRIYVSFENATRILRYDAFDAQEQWPSYTRAWRALGKNGALEAIAVDADGTIFTTPEYFPTGATEALIYTRAPGQEWEQPFNLPIDQNFRPVGADFGPDQKFYLLERAIFASGFYSRIRRMTVSGDGISDIETLLETRPGKHGNLEGLSVWRDSSGRIRLTMVSDDNYLPLMRSEMVEYVLPGGLAQADQAD